MFDIAIIFLAILIGFSVQTILGFAGGLVSLPILAFALPIPEAVATISVFNFSFSLTQTFRNYRLVEPATFKLLLPASIIGVTIGALLLSYGNPLILKKVLGIFIFVYLAYRYKKKGKLSISDNLGRLLAFVGGFFAGLFSSGAPPFVIYMSNKYEEPSLMRANLIAIFAVINVLRPVVLIVTGVLTMTVFLNSLWAVPAFLLALYLGEHAFQRLDKKLFTNIVMLFLAFAGLGLLFK